MTTPSMTAALAALLLAVAPITGCDRQEGPAEEAGEEIDQAVEEAGEQVEEAGEAVQESAEEAEDELKKGGS